MRELARINVSAIVKKKKRKKYTQSEGIQFGRRTLVAQNMQMLRSVGASYAGNSIAFASRRIRRESGGSDSPRTG